MKKLMLSVLGATALALAGCGQVPEAGARPDFPEELRGQRINLRLKGVNNPGYTSALVNVRRVSVLSVDGQALPSRLKAREAVDLTSPEHSHLIGRFVVPDGVERVTVEVEFDDFGGYEEASGGGVIDTRVAPLRFEAPVSYLSERGHAVVHLDLGQSLQAQGESRLFLPSLDVRY